MRIKLYLFETFDAEQFLQPLRRELQDIESNVSRCVVAGLCPRTSAALRGAGFEAADYRAAWAREDWQSLNAYLYEAWSMQQSWLEADPAFQCLCEDWSHFVIGEINSAFRIAVLIESIIKAVIPTEIVLHLCGAPEEQGAILSAIDTNAVPIRRWDEIIGKYRVKL